MGASGRPPKYSSVKALAEKCDEYFADCDSREKPYTVPGLAYYLGYASRQSIFDLKQNEKFSYTIKRSLLRIQAQRNQQLLTENNPAGKIFDLKENFGWKDQQQIDHTSAGQKIEERVFVVPSFDQEQGDE